MASIAASHVDLLTRPLPAVLVTVMPDGRPQASVVWIDYTGKVLSLNTERGRLKTRNLERDPRATIVIVDPDDQHRYVEVRCDVVSISEAGALDHRARLDAAYIGPEHHSDPSQDAAARVIVTLEPVRFHAYG
jgi:PPOX class probable F420-dependent enzyme